MNPTLATSGCHCGETKTTDTLNRMKYMTILAVLTAGGFGLGGIAIAQVHSDRAPGHEAIDQHADPASTVEHLAKAFPAIAAFDQNKDGKLDETEKAALSKAIAEGKVQLPGHTPPHGDKLDARPMVNHVVEMY